MPIPNAPRTLGKFIVAQIKNEVFAVQAGISCTSFISTSVARELELSFQSRDASIIIRAEGKTVAMVIAVVPHLQEDLVLGTDFLYLLDYES